MRSVQHAESCFELHFSLSPSLCSHFEAYSRGSVAAEPIPEFSLKAKVEQHWRTVSSLKTSLASTLRPWDGQHKSHNWHSCQLKAAAGLVPTALRVTSFDTSQSCFDSWRVHSSLPTYHSSISLYTGYRSQILTPAMQAFWEFSPAYLNHVRSLTCLMLGRGVY